MNKTLRYIIILGSLAGSFLLGTGYAQEQPGLRQRAQQLFDRYEYANAAGLYERLVDRKKVYTPDMERLAESYLYLKAYERAENWYARIVATDDFSKQSLWNYAEALKQNGKYREAKEQYQRYAQKYGTSDKDVSLAIAGADSAVVWMEHPTEHRLRNEQIVNTDLANFGVFLTAKGILYASEPDIFVGRRSGMTGQAYLRVYSAERSADGGLQYPNMMTESFNQAEFHIGPVIASPKGDVLYVTRTYPGSETEQHKKNGQKFRKHNLELKIYKKEDDNWIESDFAYNNVKEYSLGHAALSADGMILYYASDMPGGLGGVDIWYSEWQQDGSWSEPKNAGPEINSAGDEMFPSIVGDYLYYSSNGFAGMGGLDIFRAKGSGLAFAGRENLRFPINSAGDDFAFALVYEHEEGSMGYLSSNRSGGVGSDDIYSFHLIKPKIVILLEGLTINKKTEELIPDASVTLYGSNRQIAGKVRSDGKAEFRFNPDKNTAYTLLAEKQGFHADTVSIAAINPVKDTTLKVTLRLEPVFTVGDRFVLENIHYDFDKHNIRPDAAEILDRLVRTMRDHPTLKIELSSHTDSRGSNKYNEALSQRRAQAAVDYIVSQGIARDRLIAKGYGEYRLLNRCADGVQCSDAEHQANRRTEVEILEY